MSRIAELSQEISNLEARIVILEAELFRSDKKPNIQDLSTDMVKVDEDDSEIETRTLIGYKPRK